MQGEHRVAKSRLALIAIPTILGLLVVAGDPSNAEYRRAIPINVVCLTLAMVVLLATRRGERPAWLAMTTAIGDVTLVSFLHVVDLMQGHPSAAVNGRITFMGYFLVLVGTCIRWDRRVPLVAGGMAAFQYGAVVVASQVMWPAVATPDVLQYGQFDLGVQIERIVTLLLFAAICWSIAKWAVQLREYATTDPLTGLTNRRTFEERLRDELLRARRQQHVLSVVMFDADHFKQVNDEHGHPAGDAVLRDLATLLRSSLRRTDLLTRWGGEEFVIAYLDTAADDAAGLADTLRARVAATGIALPGGGTVRITVSGGVAAAPDDGFEVEELMRSADARLLEAKRAGRDRIVQVPVRESVPHPLHAAGR